METFLDILLSPFQAFYSASDFKRNLQQKWKNRLPSGKKRFSFG